MASLGSKISSTLALVPRPAIRNGMVVKAQASAGSSKPSQPAKSVDSIETISSDAAEFTRRSLMLAAGTVALASPLSLAVSRPAVAAELDSDWEPVPLPLDPGVVLLDLTFVPEKPDKGKHKRRRR